MFQLPKKFEKKIFMWPLAAVLLVSLVGAVSISLSSPNVPVAKAAGASCSVDTRKTFGLDNTTHPGEFGVQTVLGCNAQVKIDGDTTVWRAEKFPDGTVGWYFIQGTQVFKHNAGGITMTMTEWYSCSSVATNPVNLWKGRAEWSVQDGALNYWTFTPELWTRCVGPIPAQGP